MAVLQLNMRTLGFLLMVVAGSLRAQTTGATFGDVVKLGGTPSDIVLDESRGRLYMVNANANRVDVYSYYDKVLLGSVKVGVLPFAAAISMDNAFLYVTNNGSSTLSVIDLGYGIGTQVASVTLPAKPEGVEVGSDGRVLISTQGSSTSNLQNVLLIYDRSQAAQAQVTAVNFPPPPSTPQNLAQLFTQRPQTLFRGKLVRTPDGSLIVGVNNTNNNANTVVFVYETASGTVLRSRTSTGQSTALAMSPDGSRFMAGFTLFDTATLAVIGQMDNRNAPFAYNTAFTATANVGGSAFSKDGSTLFSAFNVASGTPLPKPSSSTLLISDPNNLAIKLGIKVPESIVAKIVMTQDGSEAWASSESGMVHLPLSTLYDYPILVPDSTTVFLAQDDCNRGIATANIKVNNIGKGRLTFSVPSTGTALAASVNTGLAPATLTLTMDPGRFGIARQAGTNLYTGNNGTAYAVNLSSPEAINIPNTIQVFMNYRQSDQRGQVFPIPVTPNGSQAQGVKDLVLDEKRGRLYVSNPGFNRIEVFDTQNQVFLNPIPAGQFPQQLAMGTDGDTLYVANTGGESITLIDLNSQTTTGSVAFPPIPRAATAAALYSVSAMAMGLSGLQFVMNNGTQWQVIGNNAVPRQASPIINNNTSTTQTALTTPVTMLSAPDYQSIVVLSGNGNTYLYDALADAFTTSRQLFTTPIQSYYGPLAAAPSSAYYLVNGLIINNSLTVLGGVTNPGSTSTTGGAGTPVTVSVVSSGNRNIAAVAPVDASTFVRLTTPVRQQLTSTTADDPRTTLTVIDINAGSEELVGVVPENPVFTVLGTARVNVAPRQMVVDSQGTVYALTLSGLSVIPLTASGSSTQPTLAPQQPLINATTGGTVVSPGSFVSVNGQNLASAAVPAGLTAPTRLGGSCVTLSDVAIPLLRTSGSQISAQIPTDMRPGTYVMQVRSLATAQQSSPVVVTVSASGQ
jgi:DNA-binding beta-propeller fold protein YncE